MTGPARTPETAAVPLSAAGPAGTGAHPRAASVPTLNLSPLARRAAEKVHAMPDPPVHVVRARGRWHWACPCGVWAAHRRRGVVERTARAHHYAERPVHRPTEQDTA
jgi:hypothetical protein